MTTTVFDGRDTYTIKHETAELASFMVSLRNFVADNQAFINDLDIADYLSGAVDDGQFVLNKFLPERSQHGTASGLSDASMKAWHEGRVL